MIHDLLQSLKVEPTRDESARQEFVSCLRGYILVDMATTMNRRFEEKVAPQFGRDNKRPPDDGPEVHKAMRSDLYFKFYSSIRFNAQEMVWRSVIPAIERNLDGLIEQARELKDDTGKAAGTVNLNNDVEVPRNVSAVDVHLAPGSLLLNMELPPNDQMQPYDSFYLDWDSYYNQEPFYKCFRDQNYEELCTRAGFDKDLCVQFVMPQFTYMDEADFKASIEASDDIDDKVGRLTAGINWFGFGGWKQA